ncbi:DUF4145 domain-containing protein [Thalassospira tepidiphila]|uniref:DUF4145 domain-containing protein n=2 Tax=Thalassospira tepidiphila TaxID=393657 RepID=A0A853KVZ1_9PROT|nr:DUF4145 domain-containing protein [Thalassospira tepidiphila]NJB76079.1 hypothetical protein [Thalassospira tepidiphila]OAZ08009.1 hypothetical protein TH4_19610 [Thalassospira tepidiphila MCCC 1A03514]
METCYSQEDDFYVVPLPDGQEDYIHNETKDYFPKPQKWEPPEWVNDLLDTDKHIDLRTVLREVYNCLNTNSLILVTIGIRTCFDIASDILGIDQNLSFAQKIKILGESGAIADAAVKEINILVQAGNAAAHRGWSPSDNQIRLLLEILELFLVKAVVNIENDNDRAKALEELENAIPARGKA